MIKIMLFASLRDQSGFSSLEIEFVSGMNVSMLLLELTHQYPALAHLLSANHKFLIAVNQDIVPRDTVLHDGDEVALLPPVTGG